MIKIYISHPLSLGDGCGIVLDGEFAYFEPMPCGKGAKYNRSRA